MNNEINLNRLEIAIQLCEEEIAADPRAKSEILHLLEQKL